MDQTQEPIKIHHQPSEEEEHHENGASKMFRKVKAKAKKIKNSLTKHGQSHEQDHDVVELEPEAIGAPVRSGVTSQPESLNHPREANVPAPEEIVPPGTKVFPVVSSDYIKPIEPTPLQDVSYGHDAPAYSVRTTNVSDKEEKSEAPIHQPLSELSDREERGEPHHEGLKTPVSLLSATEDVIGTFSPGGEDEYLGGQRNVSFETPKKFEDDSAVTGGGSEYLSGANVSDYQSKVTDPTKEGSGEAGVPDISESLSRMNVSDEYSDQKSELGYERDLSSRSKDFQESELGRDSPKRFSGEGAKLSDQFPAISHEFDQTGSGIDKSSPTRNHEFDMKIESTSDTNSPSRSHEFDLQTEPGVEKILPVGFDCDSGAELGKELPTERREFDQKIESGRNEISPTESGGGLGAPLGGNFPVGNQNESEIGKDFPMGFGRESGEDFPAKESHEYGKQTEDYFPTRNDDVKVETEVGTHEQFSPELPRATEKYDFEETRDETIQETKPNTYTEQIASATLANEGDDFEETRDETKPSTYTEQIISVKNDVASKLGYSGETPVKDETEVAHEKSRLVGVEEETEHEEDKGVSTEDYLSEKLTPGEEDKALSEVLVEKLKIEGEEEEKKETEVNVEKIPSKESEKSETVAEEEKAVGGGMVGILKGWFGGGTTEEVKPNSPPSVQESSQSLDTTVVPVRREVLEYEN